MQKECTRQNNSIFVKLNNRYNIFEGIDTRALHHYITSTEHGKLKLRSKNTDATQRW